LLEDLINKKEDWNLNNRFIILKNELPS
jgi:hypothetical protein